MFAGAKLFFYDAKHVYRLRQRMKEEKLQLSDLDWRDIYIKKHVSCAFKLVYRDHQDSTIIIL